MSRWAPLDEDDVFECKECGHQIVTVNGARLPLNCSVCDDDVIEEDFDDEDLDYDFEETWGYA
jgi:hypothetical protein